MKINKSECFIYITLKFKINTIGGFYEYGGFPVGGFPMRSLLTVTAEKIGKMLSALTAQKEVFCVPF